MADGTPTVAQYVVNRLAELGIRHAFGVPGDYAFPLDDAIEEHESLEWIVSANELNAAYAADGYARVRGAALLCTTSVVGELSALNAVMGSKAERVPVFHLVGAPSTRLRRDRAVMHHSFGDGELGQFMPLSEATACASAVITPENAVAQMERVIAEALHHSQPAYINVPEDFALMPVVGTPVHGTSLASIDRVASDRRELDAAVAMVLERMESSASVTLLPAFTVARFGLEAHVERLLDRTGAAYATTRMDKGVIAESHPRFLGIYQGADSHPDVRAAVEEADLVVDVGGVVLSEYNTGAWSHRLDRGRMVTIGIDCVRVGDVTFGPVAMQDMLEALAERAPHRPGPSGPEHPDLALVGEGSDAVSSAALYPRLERFLREGDMVFTDTGLSAGPLTALRLPDGASFHYQTLWGSIGWATGAAFGAAVADPTRRVVLVTGDGAHQMTANDIGAMGRYGVAPVIIVLNNGVYGIEEVLSRREGHVYDDIAPWRYADLPAAMGYRGWYTSRIETVGELEKALADASSHQGACYLEIVLDRTDLPPKYGGEVLDALYKTAPVRA